MSALSDNQNWIIEVGDQIIQKRAAAGSPSLSLKERLLLCLWVADYCMCNAGDLSQSNILYEHWKQEAAQLAQQLSLAQTFAFFSLDEETLALQYFERFEHICNEIRSA